MSEALHSPFGPSSLARRELCPGSYRQEKDLSGVDTPLSQEGTRLHAKVAEMITEYDSGKEVKEAEEEEVNEAFGYFFGLVNALQSPFEVYAEYRMCYKYAWIEQFFGTADVVIVTEDRIIIIDWKFGRLPVPPAEENAQGAAYALMAMQEFSKERAEVHFFNPVIHQKTATTFNDRGTLSVTIMKIIAAAQEDNAPLRPSEDACRYCKAMQHGTCPALAKTTEIAVSDAEKVVPLPALSVIETEDLCSMKDRCDLIGRLAERIDSEIKRRCEEKGSCGAWKIKETSGGREIKDILGAFAASGMDSKDFLEACTVSVSKLEKSYAKQGKETGKFKTEKEGKEIFGTILAEFISPKPNKKCLVKAEA